MSFRWIDNDRSKSRHEITGYKRSILFLENTNVTARVARRVQNTEIPSRITRKLDPFVVFEGSVDLNKSFQVPRRDRVRRDLHTALSPQMIRATHVIAVQMSQPDLLNLPFLEKAIEQLLFFVIRRRRINYDHLAAADDITIRVSRGWQRRSAKRHEAN